MQSWIWIWYKFWKVKSIKKKKKRPSPNFITISAVLKSEKQKKKKKSSPHFGTFPSFHFQFSFFSSPLFNFFPCLFFPVDQQKFPGQMSLGGNLPPCPRLLRNWLSCKMHHILKLIITLNMTKKWKLAPCALCLSKSVRGPKPHNISISSLFFLSCL